MIRKVKCEIKLEQRENGSDNLNSKEQTYKDIRQYKACGNRRKVRVHLQHIEERE